MFVAAVSGDIRGGELGFCQCHEHLYIAKGMSYNINHELCIDDVQKSAEELKAYKEAGGFALVDAQPVGCGRDAEVLEKISRESGVHIIASTGFHKLVFYPAGHWIFQYGEDKLARIFIEELITGMYGLCDSEAPLKKTGIKAGQIKTALDVSGLRGRYRHLFEAAVNAANETGRALMVHIEPGSNPVELADFLMKSRVNPERVIFCHMDRAVPDLGVHRDICSRSITLLYDTVARPKYHDDAREIEILIKMLGHGFWDRILMSLDTTRARLKSYGGVIGLDYILTAFLPKLEAAGVNREIIDGIFIKNPMRMFTN